MLQISFQVRYLPLNCIYDFKYRMYRTELSYLLYLLHQTQCAVLQVCIFFQEMRHQRTLKPNSFYVNLWQLYQRNLI